MFLNELTPLLQSGFAQPLAFLGGLCAGMLRLDLSQDPVKTWLDQQMGQSYSTTPSTAPQNGSSGRPKSIEIE